MHPASKSCLLEARARGRRVIEVRDGAYLVTDDGERRLEDAGIEVARLRRERRALARPCLDWTERRPHLAGALGAAIAASALE
jgi:hypothetical protein